MKLRKKKNIIGSYVESMSLQIIPILFSTYNSTDRSQKQWGGKSFKQMVLGQWLYTCKRMNLNLLPHPSYEN